MTDSLPEPQWLEDLPLTDEILDAIEHALGGCFRIDDNGDHVLIGADYTLSQLLDFLSGYDEANSVPNGEIAGVPCYVYPFPIYSEHDLIRALVKEVRRLRE